MGGTLREDSLKKVAKSSWNITKKKMFRSKKWISFPIIILISAFSHCFGISKPEVFMMHPNRILVESGCYFGDGIRNALFAGFQEVHSIELSSKYYNYCKSLFKDNDNVLLYEGDSGKILFEVIKDINEPITFWLDGHCSLGDTAKGEGMTPILQELEQIKKHHIKTHTILIDDVRQFGTWNFDFISLEQILNKILEINSNYIFSFDDGFCSNDILVAEIR